MNVKPGRKGDFSSSAALCINSHLLCFISSQLIIIIVIIIIIIIIITIIIGRGRGRSSQKMSPNPFSMEPDLPKFSCGSDLASLAVASDLAYLSWMKISEFQRTLVHNSCSESESIQLKEFVMGKFNVVAFVSAATPQFLQNNGGLVSSDRLDDFKFLSSETDPEFAINEAAVSLFRSVRPQLKDKIVESATSTPYIITGHGVGGSVAALFTLWLLDSLDPTKTKRPLCIAFGSPLVGDRNFQQAVSKYSTWNSCFLQVVHKEDKYPNFFDSKLYCPFGTYLFCSESGSACFEASESAAVVLKKMKNSHGSGGGVQEFDYGPVIECLRGKAIIAEDTGKEMKRGDGDWFKFGIEAQLAAIGFQQRRMKVNEIVEHEIDSRNTPSIGTPTKLCEMKLLLAQLEWYKKRAAYDNVGYYDSYKNMQGTKDIDVVYFKGNLDIYWKTIVAEVKKKPQKADAELRLTWLYNCTVYRRMIEPLHIAEYYREKKGGSYVERRPEFLKKLEELTASEETVKDPIERRKMMMGYNMTEDSCFWAYVEEAKKSCESLISGRTDRDYMKELKEFEKYVFDQIKIYGVSREIFLSKSSFMTWWELYKKVLERKKMGLDHHPSRLIQFMRKVKYEEYKEGTYAPWEED